MTAIAIEMMSGRARGAFQRHARRAGLSLDEYIARRVSGFKRCNACGDWKSEAHFPSDAANSDGLYASCRDCSSRANRRQRQLKRFPTAALAARLAAIDEQRSERARVAKLAAQALARQQRKHDRDPDVQVFRLARRAHRTDFERALPDARREFAAFLATQEKKMRGGRPPKRRNL